MLHRIGKVLAGAAVCLLGQFCAGAYAQETGLILPTRAGEAVELVTQGTPLDRAGADVLEVFVGPPEACCAGKAPIAGTYGLEGQLVSFAPAFEFITGQAYTVRVTGKTVSLSRFVIAPEQAARAPNVLAIFPSGPVIPENTLRFYIQFSTPMMPHRAGEFIKLVDADGRHDPAAFMSFTQELWNEDRTRLTLLMDPGRIKRGVAQNIDLGPALLEGEHYAIVIEEGWHAANGPYATERFERSFGVGPALRRLPDVSLWQVNAPHVASRTPLRITFDRPFDAQLTKSAIVLRDENGQRISGTVLIDDHEHSWRFEPDSPWAVASLRIIVDTRLEDVAGNNFRDLLDHALSTSPRAVEPKVIVVDLLQSAAHATD